MCFKVWQSSFTYGHDRINSQSYFGSLCNLRSYEHLPWTSQNFYKCLFRKMPKSHGHFMNCQNIWGIALYFLVITFLFPLRFYCTVKMWTKSMIKANYLKPGPRSKSAWQIRVNCHTEHCIPPLDKHTYHNRALSETYSSCCMSFAFYYHSQSSARLCACVRACVRARVCVCPLSDNKSVW